MERDTELTYIRKERDWLSRAQAGGRDFPHDRLLPVLPANLAGNGKASNGADGTEAGTTGGGAASVHHK